MAVIGLDFGSVARKAVVLDGQGRLAGSYVSSRNSGAIAQLDAFLDQVEGVSADAGVRVGMLGSDGPMDDRVLAVNAILAVGAGVHRLHPSARTVIEVGGHTSKLLVLSGNGEVRDFATNEACAAGTGSFLEQQARRLGLSISQLAELAVGARRGATVAGRCAVFAASDMIHLQQKGTPLAEIAYGLCLAIARNCLTTLLKGREVARPAVIAGGCAANRGLLRAFAEVLGIRDGGRLAPSLWPGLEGAIGVALAAEKSERPRLSRAELQSLLLELWASAVPAASADGALRRPTSRPHSDEPSAPTTVAEGWVGIDVGSVSTDLVVLDAEGELVSAVYLPTRGRPADTLLEGLAMLAGRLPADFRMLGFGTTGSARYLAGKLLRADVVKNEITCQLLGVRRYVPDVDTVFEIGGQDSKFIAVRDGAIADFAMNKVCAAGTGSFLEEQASGLGVDVFREFADRAFASSAPLDLGSRCTVFMETEAASALAGGAALDDVCAGLAKSIARNYLEKVVGPRPLGRRIVFSGGVASNAAVVAAFESLLDIEIRVHPYNRISGAIGAALAAQAARQSATEPSRFVGFAPTERPTVRAFECRHCANRCEVNVIESERERAYFGDTCERYTTGSGEVAVHTPNLVVEYRQMCESLFAESGGSGLRIGVPRASSVIGALPFWATFFRELGHRPVLSEPSSQATLAHGLQHLSTGMCLPIKLTAGHVHELLGQDVDRVFVPAVVTLPGEGPSFSCPYTMAVPFIVGAPHGSRLLAPVVSFESEETFASGFEPFLESLGVDRDRLRGAYRSALWAQARMDDLFRVRAGQALENRQGRLVFAVLGRPYSSFDSYVNLGLFERLRRLDVLAIPLAFLPWSQRRLARSPLPWRYPADLHDAALRLAAEDQCAGRRLHPVVVSSFGCGPDAFTLRQVEAALVGRAHLVLELDEHRGEAGLVTRVEAFLDQIEGPARQPAPARRIAAPAMSFVPSRPSTIRIPHFADHAFAFSGAFRFAGHDAQVLSPPDAESRRLGERYSLGKECHAFSMLVGDLLKLRADGAEPGTVFYFPGTSLPCLVHEYGRGMEAILSELDATSIRISSPTGAELVAALGREAAERLYVGILAIELLIKAVCQIRPYELEPGRADAIHRANLARIEAAVASGDIYDALGESLRLLATNPLTARRERPIVGLAGDVYTKVNPFANQDLVRWLEAQGIEVWPSPCQIDLIDFGISRNLYHSLATMDFAGLMLHGAVALRREVDSLRIRNVIGGRVARIQEPGYLEMRKLAAPYMPNEAHALLFVNVAKIVDFARQGVDGIVNAICFGCMVGNASAAVVERIRRDHGDVPILTAVYAGGDDPARRMALEAFVSQVKSHHARQQAPIEESLLGGWLRRAAS